jgi:hypothetical protein
METANKILQLSLERLDEMEEGANEGDVGALTSSPTKKKDDLAGVDLRALARQSAKTGKSPTNLCVFVMPKMYTLISTLTNTFI